MIQMPLLKSHSVSVIVPVYQGGAAFRRCLQCLCTLEPAPHEIIVVEDGSRDGSGLLATEWGARVISVPQNEGPASARNRGAAIATGEILYFVDADVEVPTHAIAQVMDSFHAQPDLAALIGSYDDTPAAPNFLSQYKNLLHHYTHQTACEKASTFWGACGAIRRDVFNSLGGFNVGWRNRVEDIELGYRLNQAGFAIQLNKTLQVKHLKQWTAISLVQADVFFRAIPWTLLIFRERKLQNDLNLRHSSRASVLLVYALVLSCLAIPWWPLSATLAAIGVALALFLVNLAFYRFLWCKRGGIFAAQSVFWHWLYYFYGGLAFGVGAFLHGCARLGLSSQVVQRSTLGT